MLRASTINSNECSPRRLPLLACFARGFAQFSETFLSVIMEACTAGDGALG